MAEGLIKKYLPEVEVFSAGAKPIGIVVDGTKKVLEEEGIWSEKEFYSKGLDEVEKFGPFDLAVTVCDSAKSCITYLNAKKQIHIGLEDPFLKGFEEFLKTKDEILNRVIPKIKKNLK
jgi:protein-tyrosine-phosphatase